MAAALRQLDGEEDWARRTVVVQGLGEVGSRVARVLCERGAKVLAAEADPAYVGLAHPPHPKGVSTKDPHTKTPAHPGARIMEHVEGRPQEEVHAYRLQLLPGNPALHPGISPMVLQNTS